MIISRERVKDAVTATRERHPHLSTDEIQALVATTLGLDEAAVADVAAAAQHAHTAQDT